MGSHPETHADYTSAKMCEIGVEKMHKSDR